MANGNTLFPIKLRADSGNYLSWSSFSSFLQLLFRFSFSYDVPSDQVQRLTVSVLQFVFNIWRPDKFDELFSNKKIYEYKIYSGAGGFLILKIKQIYREDILRGGAKMWILFSSGKTIFYERGQRVSKILFLSRENKIHILKPPCNVVFII